MAKHWLNDKAEFHWEIVRNGKVVEVIPKTGDDGNRSEAMRRLRRLRINAMLPRPRK